MDLNRILQQFLLPSNLRWTLFISFSALPLTVSAFFRKNSQQKRLGGWFRKLLTASEKEPQSLVDYWSSKDQDNFFLQEVLGEKALTWVKKRNEDCTNQLGDVSQTPTYSKILSILDSKEKIPYVGKIYDFYYNFWQDEKNPRGIWRRTTLASYKSLEPKWELVIDVDALGKEENESWVYKGYMVLDVDPAVSPLRRILLSLSRGGSDATVRREFDLTTCQFVSEFSEDAFEVPEAKSYVSWKNENVLIIGTKWTHDKEVSSLTDSGYPRLVKEWTRGTPLDSAVLVYEGEQKDMLANGMMLIPFFYVYRRHVDHRYEWRTRMMTFYTSKNMVKIISGEDSSSSSSDSSSNNGWYDIPVQEDASLSFFRDHLLISLRSDWSPNDSSQSYPAGSLLAVPMVAFVQRQDTSQLVVLFTPSATVSLESYDKTKDYLILTTLETVKTRLSFWRYDKKNSDSSTATWTLSGMEAEAKIQGISITPVDDDESNEYWLTTNSFLMPTRLYLVDASETVKGLPSTAAAVQAIKSLSPQFNHASELMEQQYLAISEDGTAIPYFVLSHKDLPYDSQTPTLLYGYGGFEISMTPSYSASIGCTWLNPTYMDGKKTCYVVAYIRGGGEFGPTWHQAALKASRHKAYEDFIAVAKDLIARKITSPQHLAIRGGSNGGLLMGNMFTMAPDLFAAICCAVPLLDMKHYHTLLAGASWMAEYGNPDLPEDWSFLQRYSAYHNIDVSRAKTGNYPAFLMTTSTKDDRVHPYHARCFVKRLEDARGGGVLQSSDSSRIKQGQVIYYENMEGGHGGAADNKQQAYMNALYIEFLRKVIL